MGLEIASMLPNREQLGLACRDRHSWQVRKACRDENAGSHGSILGRSRELSWPEPIDCSLGCCGAARREVDATRHVRGIRRWRWGWAWGWGGMGIGGGGAGVRFLSLRPSNACACACAGD